MYTGEGASESSEMSRARSVAWIEGKDPPKKKGGREAVHSAFPGSGLPVEGGMALVFIL